MQRALGFTRRACPAGWVHASYLILIVLGLALGLMPVTAHAQTDEIQVYDAEIAAPGAINLTLHNNYTPNGLLAAEEPGGVIPNHSWNGVPEWAYGVTPWFEAGLYFPLYSIGGGSVRFNGFKLRTLFVEPNAADHTFVYGINFEYSYNEPHWDPHRYSSEIRPIIGWHWGAIDLIINPILDNVFEGFGKLDFAPEARLAWNVSRTIAIAAEEYDDLGPIEHFYGHDQQSHQLFSVFDFHKGAFALEVGLGFGLSAGSDHRVIKLILSRDLYDPSGS